MIVDLERLIDLPKHVYWKIFSVVKGLMSLQGHFQLSRRIEGGGNVKIQELFLDSEIATTFHGELYGLDYVINETDYSVEIYLDLFSRRIRVLSYECENFSEITKRLERIAIKNR